MNEEEKKKIFEIMLDMLDLMHRMAKLVGVRESLVDALIECKEKEKIRRSKNKKRDENTPKFDGVEKAIIKVNEKDQEIDGLASRIVNSETQFKDKDKVKALLKAIAICKIAGISEYHFSHLIRENEELRGKIGNFDNIKNFYHAMKYTAIWKYRNDVYRIFNLKIREEKEVIECIYCGSTDVIKQGTRKTRKGKKQRYYCKSCGKSFVIHRDKEVIVYDKKWKDIAGRLYLEQKLLLRDIIEIMKNNCRLNVSSVTISNWINDYIRENLQNLTQAQKNLLLIKKVIEVKNKDVDGLVSMIRNKWNYRITHIRVYELMASYRKIRKNEDLIKKMLDDGHEIHAIAEKFKVNKDMLEVLYGEK